jgi:hypothetical protein
MTPLGVMPIHETRAPSEWALSYGEQRRARFIDAPGQRDVNSRPMKTSGNCAVLTSFAADATRVGGQFQERIWYGDMPCCMVARLLFLAIDIF